MGRGEGSRVQGEKGFPVFCTGVESITNLPDTILLLDAVDEMTIESSHALAQISNFLQGWVGDATVVLTCRLNVWDAGKNACSDFDTFRNLNFTYGNNQTPDLVKKIISSWFRDNQSLAVNLRTELDKLERQRIKDAVLWHQ